MKHVLKWVYIAPFGTSPLWIGSKKHAGPIGTPRRPQNGQKKFGVPLGPPGPCGPNVGAQNIETRKQFWTDTETAVFVAQRQLCLWHIDNCVFGAEIIVALAQR